MGESDRVTLLRQRFNDFDEFAARLRKWDIDFRQLDRGPFTALVVQAQGARSCFCRGTLGRAAEEHGSPPQGFVSFSLHADSAQQHKHRGQTVRGNNIVVLPGGSEVNGVSQAGFDVFALSLSHELLAEIAESLGRPDLEVPPAGSEVVTVPRLAVNSLRRDLRRFDHELARHNDELEDSRLERELGHDLPRRLLLALAGSQPLHKEPVYRVRERALERALAFIDEYHEGAPSLGELCEAAGASERTLQYAFRDRFDLSPSAYLRALRLNRVRRQLLAADPRSTKVSDVANHWGYWHMGQFAVDYKRHFGEKPSETLARPS